MGNYFGRFIASFSFAFVLLAGCSNAPQHPRVSGEWLDVAPRWSSFDLAGRITVRNGEDAFSGSFRWRHAPAIDAIDLNSPLGQTVAQLSRDAQGIQMRMSDGKTLRADAWETLTQRVLGWSLPVGGLVYWAQAAAVPDAPYRTIADEGGQHLGELRQQGWTIRYRAYDEQNRPTRLALDYDTLEIRIAVDAWETDPVQLH